MTEAANIERQKRRQAEFVTDEQQRLLEIEDMRLVVKFGEKKRYSDQECQAIYQELVEAGLDDEARRNPDAIEAVFKELNAADEAETARRDLLRLNRTMRGLGLTPTKVVHNISHGGAQTDLTEAHRRRTI